MNAPDKLALTARMSAFASGTSLAHESAVAQVRGLATYVDDITEAKGTLFAAPILSNQAHGKLLSVDTSVALLMPGVRACVLASDIPGHAMLASFIGDEPIFAMDTVQHIGQVVGLVVAETVMQARHAARKVKLNIETLPAILSLKDAMAAQSYVLPPVFVKRGDADSALARAPHRLTGTLEVGGQEHFYLEGQVAYALPQEQNQWLVHSSTQHPGEVQHWVAHALGLDNHAVRVECRRMGGGFGGKETQAGHMAVWAAIAARTQPALVRQPSIWTNWLRPAGWGMGGVAAGVLAAGAVFLTVPALFMSADQVAMRAGEKLPQSYVGLLTDAAGNGKVLASSLRHGKTMNIKVIGPFTPPAAGRLVLWAVPANAPAFAIGTVPTTGSAASVLPDTSEKLLSKVSQLIVTVETDAMPTKPGENVFFRGNCAKLW